MSAFPPEADMLIVGINVCFVPKADIGRGPPWAPSASVKFAVLSARIRELGLQPRGRKIF
jgi:hypothetical protein